MSIQTVRKWLAFAAWAFVFALAHVVLLIRVALTWPAWGVNLGIEKPLFRLLDRLSA